MYRYVGHPTRFVMIVQRIARRRFVSFEEIEGRILDWYCNKWEYPRYLIWNHGISRQLSGWREMDGVVGQFLWNGFFDSERRRHPALFCRLEDGHRVDTQHCECCGRGINPVWNGKPKKRLTCRHPACHDFYRWRRERFGWLRREKREFYWGLATPELQRLYQLTRFLEAQAKRCRKKRKSTNGAPRASAIFCSTRS